MKSFLRKTIGIITSLAMLLVLFLMPQSALAKRPGISNGHGPGNPGGGEGDPLDSNDFSSGGDGEVQDQRSIPRDYGDGIISLLDSGKMLILRIDYVGGIPVFTLQVIAAEEFLSEANHER